MADLDLLLSAPSEAELAAALDRAAPSALRDPDRWRAVLDEVAANDEGRSQLESSSAGEYGARYVSVAWWSDHRGVKHARVCGGDTGDGGWHPHYSRLDHDIRPPLWHVFMDRLYRVTRGGRSRWLASCACGETGPPEELAWMGERCGPCHDRREEGVGLGEGGPVTLKAERSCHAVAFSPDSKRLAVSSEPRELRLHDLATGQMRSLHGATWPDPADGFRPIAFAPDGHHLSAGDVDEWEVLSWDLTRGGDYAFEMQLPPEILSLFSPGFSPEFAPLRALEYSAESRYLISLTNSGTLHIWKRGDERLEALDQMPHVYDALAFRPDGRALALAHHGGRVAFHDAWSPDERDSLTIDLRAEDEFVQFVHYTPDGHRLVLITGMRDPNWRNTPHHLRLWDLASRRELKRADFPFHTRVAALSPDGRFLAHVVHDEQHAPGEVLFWDLAAWAEAGRIEWDPDDTINDIAFSPDGATLATASENGVVKLIPWRLLLEG